MYNSPIGGSKRAGYPTKYGIVRQSDQIRYDPKTGLMIKQEAGVPLFASGRNTGNYVAGNVARLRTPIRVNYNIESKNNYQDVA